MQKIKKITLRTFLAFLILIPIAAIAHFIIFPQETRSILIGYSNFKKNGHIYFNATTPETKIDSLKLLIEKASIRVGNFWGEKTSNPRFIYCDKEDDLKKYSINPSAPAVTYIKLGAVIILSADGFDLDIIAHEISHTEFYNRIGFYAFMFRVPSWFKHGLAMQNDHRAYYSEDTLKAHTDNLKNMPDIKLLKKDEQFYAGSRQQVMLNYMAAKQVVKNWWTKKRLDKLIKELNAGRSFDEAFGQ